MWALKDRVLHPWVYPMATLKATDGGGWHALARVASMGIPMATLKQVQRRRALLDSRGCIHGYSYDCIEARGRGASVGMPTVTLKLDHRIEALLRITGASVGKPTATLQFFF